MTSFKFKDFLILTLVKIKNGERFFEKKKETVHAYELKLFDVLWLS